MKRHSHFAPLGGANFARSGSAGKRVVGSLILALFLNGCSLWESDVDLETLSAQEIYELGEIDLEAGRQENAAFYFGEVERLYPYSEWTKRALIMRTFAYHEAEDYAQSRVAALRYINFYPASGDADYAQYLLALSYYDQIDDVGRDQSLAREALVAFRTLIERYPDSKYQNDAQERLALTLNHLAAKEMEVGRYYLSKGHFSAAAKRFQLVAKDYPDTPQAPEALHRLVEVYLSLGLAGEATTAANMLSSRYPQSPWSTASASLLNGDAAEDNSTGLSLFPQIYRRMILGEWL